MLLLSSPACSRDAPPPAAASTQVTSAALAPVAHGRAFALTMQATSCWTGGLWSDALGEKGDARLAGIEARCRAVLRQEGGSTIGAYAPLRAIDRTVVDELAASVGEIASEDPADAPHARALVAFLRAVADATRETLVARRAADQVKADRDAEPSKANRVADKNAAAPLLKEASALHALLEFDGPYSGEAHTLGLLEAIDRVEIARGLPKHLKIYAVQGAFADVFNVWPPATPDDAATPLRTGTWLLYLRTTAAAAGHATPAGEEDPQRLEPLAYNGVLEGFADRLRAPPVASGSPLGDVARAVAARLDEQFRNERAAYDASRARK